MSFPIDDSKHANPEHRITVGMGQNPETLWHQAQSASDATTLQPAEVAPVNWTSSPTVGLRRMILFFDTTGVSQDLVLKLNAGDSPTGSGTVYVLNGNGADYDFGDEIYGWIAGRFSAEYLITSKDLADIIVGINYFNIPASHINSSGYTVLCLVLAADYADTYTPSGSAKLQAYTGQLKLSGGGHIWVEGTMFAYIDSSNQKRTKEGTLEGATGKIAGHIWVEGTKQRYIDSSGNERYIEGTLTGLTGKLPSQLSINTKSPMLGTHYCYIDDEGKERCFEGTLS